MARWAVFTEVAAGMRFFAVKNVFKYLILCQWLGFRFWVMYVNSNHNGSFCVKSPNVLKPTVSNDLS